MGPAMNIGLAVVLLAFVLYPGRRRPGLSRHAAGRGFARRRIARRARGYQTRRSHRRRWTAATTTRGTTLPDHRRQGPSRGYARWSIGTASAWRSRRADGRRQVRDRRYRRPAEHASVHPVGQHRRSRREGRAQARRRRPAHQRQDISSARQLSEEIAQARGQPIVDARRAQRRSRSSSRSRRSSAERSVVIGIGDQRSSQAHRARARSKRSR